VFNLIAQADVTTYQITSDTGAAFAVTGFMFVWMFILWAIYIVAFWKVFEKAGEAGWKSIIPFYNIWIMFEIAGRPGWWLLFMFIPFANFVVAIVLALDMAKAFGKSAAFGIFGLFFFSFIGYMMLGWGDAKYVGGGTEATAE